MGNKFTMADTSKPPFPLMKTVSQHEDRLKEIEGKLSKIEHQLEGTATKLDVERAVNSSQRWVIGTVIIGVVSLFLALRSDPSQTNSPQQPTVIVVPSSR